MSHDEPPALYGTGCDLGTVLDSVPVPLFIKDRDGRYVTFNAAFRAQYLQEFGEPAEALAGLSCVETSQSGEAASLVQDTDRRVLDYGETCSFVLPFMFPDGNEHRLLLRKAPYREPGSGIISGITTMILDVTELTTVQQALADSEQRYRELVEHSNTVIMELDRDGAITFCNEFSERFLGYPAAGMIGRGAAEFLAPEPGGSHRDLSDLMAVMAAAPDGYRQMEGEHLTGDGRRVWLSWTATAVHDARGEIVGLRCIGHDITARKHMEQRLRISEAAIESSQEAMGIADLNGTILSVNQAYLDFWNCQSRDEVVGHDVAEFMISADTPEIIAAIRAGGWVGERESRRRDGSTFYMRVSANLVRDELGQPLCLMASLQDITERTLAERELAKFKLISDTAGYGSVIVGPDFTIRYCNEAFAAMHGYSIAELLGQPMAVLHDEEQWAEVVRLGHKLRREGRLTAERLWRRRRDGRVFPGLLSVHLIPGTEPDGLRAVTVVDISALEEAMSQLTEQKERLAVTLASIADGVIATDVAGQITLMNPVAEKLTGWTQDEALGRPVAEVCQVANSGGTSVPLGAISDVLANGREAELPAALQLIARDGSERHVAGVAAPTRDDDGELLGAVLAIRDITEQERLRQEAYQAHRLESLGLLAGGIAHDFNNLLTSILGGISLARTGELASPEANEGLQTSEQAALLARHLSRQLLTFSRGGDPIKRPLWLTDMLSGAADMALSGTNCHAELALPDDLWPVEGDAAQLAQVLNNALLNAVQAMPQGGIVRLAAANVTADPTGPGALAPGRYVRIRVVDEGEGIDPKALPRVFDPYFTTKPGGSGLGLTIAYSVITRHDGHISLSSRRGQGTTVTVHLPASDAVPAGPPDEPSGLPAGGGRVLVMDDDPFVRRVVGPMLKRLGYEARVVTDTNEALAEVAAAAAAGRPFAAAILDLTIRGGPGGAVIVGALRDRSPGVKLLACSGYHEDPIMARGHDSGFDGVLLKPYQLTDLGLALAGLLSTTEAPATDPQ